MSKLLNELNKYKESCLDDNGYVVEGKAEDLVFQSAKAIERYENVIHAIANIDTIFMLQDGTNGEWNDKEALEEIEKMVTPIWNEHCEESRKETDKMFKEWGIKANLD